MHDDSDGVVVFSLRPLSAAPPFRAAPSFRLHMCRFCRLHRPPSPPRWLNPLTAEAARHLYPGHLRAGYYHFQVPGCRPAVECRAFAWDSPGPAQGRLGGGVVRGFLPPCNQLPVIKHTWPGSLQLRGREMPTTYERGKKIALRTG